MRNGRSSGSLSGDDRIDLRRLSILKLRSVVDDSLFGRESVRAKNKGKITTYSASVSKSIIIVVYYPTRLGTAPRRTALRNDDDRLNDLDLPQSDFFGQISHLALLLRQSLHLINLHHLTILESNPDRNQLRFLVVLIRIDIFHEL